MTSQIILANNQARTATETFEVHPNGEHSGVFIINTVSGAGVSDTLTVSIEGYDVASRSWYTILTSAVITTNTKTILKVGIDYTAEANVIAKDFLPRKFRLIGTKNNATPITYSVGVNLIA